MLVQPYLTKVEIENVGTTAEEWKAWSLFGDSPIFPPRSPMLWRFTGFGRRNPLICARHADPSPYLILHHAWDYISMVDRSKLASATPVMRAYALLRKDALLQSVAELRAPRPPTSGAGISRRRARLMGCALLRFDFHYGDLIRWLGGEYTNEHRNWGSTFQAVNALKDHPVQPGYPGIDYGRAFQICTEGIPLAGIYECSFNSVLRRNKYGNHPALIQQEAKVREKLRGEEENSFHLLLPRFICRFIPGLHLSPLTFTTRKNKGRVCVDCTNQLDSDDDGSPNKDIPKPGTPNREDENPTIHIATAMKRHLEWIWNLRITYPKEDIIQHGDDIHAFFHRVLYHPDMAIVFAYVFMEFLIVPVGAIFGARNSPSYCCLLSEVRCHLAACGPKQPLTDLASSVRIIPRPTTRETSRIVPAVPDSRHQGVPKIQQDRSHHAMYVDDNITAALRRNIRGAINDSVTSAYTLLGGPGEDRRVSCLSDEKWADFASHEACHLGFLINTRDMTVTWPVEKRQQLREQLEELWLHHPCHVTPRQIAVLLGTVRNAAMVAPLGAYLSIRLQQCLTDEMHKREHSDTKKWWVKTGAGSRRRSGGRTPYI